ncbi:GNAT family N-acetyltransferase [Microbacterium sp. W1N]|uniref:GNAT family N-acetyltransferase n=1 Tax=Microbacterium festucae TaxID=2977531 RepID=UPI0021BFE2E8|nr:GNAT family N-acetyltransferase [Microbacterium festucae]MCT9820602.1 GNAT family N-acetyltransferase [Microbacterium festucae]
MSQSENAGIAGFHSAPLDEQLTAAITGQGLEVRRVDDAVRAETDPWLDAVGRGFLDSERNDTQREAFFDRTAYRRKIGVYDAAGAEPALPVATFASWESQLTVPGGTVPACAISSVTVAPTHRRRGLLSAVMAGELRTAVSQGFPLAALTVSESGIYGRFGFAPAAAAAHWEIAVRRARWIGPTPAGRIDFVSRETGRALAPGLHERTRLASPGEIDMPGGHWDRAFGTRPDADKPERLRVVQYRSAEGDDIDGLAVYSVSENHDDYAASTVDISMLLAATDDAYAALWRFFLSMDLIGTIRAGELAVDEPLWWMISDQRAAKITVRDHQYLRVLDVPAALAARRYDVADAVALEVDDPLDIAGGAFVLTVDDDGRAEVDAVDAPPPGIPSVRLGVAELSALLLGGVSPVTLARAGRLQADDPERLARLFAAPAAPRLSFWY